METHTQLGLTFRYVRMKHSLSLRDAAKKMGKSHTFLARVESGNLSLSDHGLDMLNALYGTQIHGYSPINFEWITWVDSVLQTFLNGDFLSLQTKKSELVRWQKAAEQSPLYVHYDILMWVIDVHLEPANLEKNLKKKALFVPLFPKLQGSIAWLAYMTLFRIAFYSWKLNDALAYLEQARSITSHPHYKAVIDLGQAEMKFHQYNRPSALRINYRARETFGYFNNYLRRALAEVRGELYRNRQIHFDAVDYVSLKSKAITFQLPELIQEVQLIHALRALYLKRFDDAIALLKTLNQENPQIYFYTAMAYHQREDLEGLNTHLNRFQTHYVVPQIFAHGLAYLKAVATHQDPSVIQTHLNAYLDHALAEKIYGETRWAEREFRKLYEKNRQYKALTAVFERITETIMKP